MTTILAREGEEALKPFAHSDLREIQRLANVIDSLRASGVPVPQCRIDHARAALRLAWIQGPTLRERIEQNGLVSKDLHAAMVLLRSLHLSQAAANNLGRFDPFRQTDRRLAEPWFGTLPRELQDDGLVLRQALRISPAGRPGVTIIHGDFHAGQLMLETALGKWWMIDLDDVALGHPEVDIANFCVNLATHRASPAHEINQCIADLQTDCGQSYEVQIDNVLFDYYAACALLRRALKFASRPGSAARAASVLTAGFMRVRPAT